MKVVLQAKKMNVGGSWNLDLIEDKLREKIHERVGGTSLFEVSSTHPSKPATICYRALGKSLAKIAVIKRCVCKPAIQNYPQVREV